MKNYPKYQVLKYKNNNGSGYIYGSGFEIGFGYESFKNGNATLPLYGFNHGYGLGNYPTKQMSMGII